ncbi:hypothetical protein G6F58_013938 [Rhizopus delemar]|nr:hypothetical protein G6F58_013938 [Rhizopus delemar]
MGNEKLDLIAGEADLALRVGALPDSNLVARKLGSTLLRMGELPPPYNDKPMQIWGQSREQWRKRAR